MTRDHTPSGGQTNILHRVFYSELQRGEQEELGSIRVEVHLQNFLFLQERASPTTSRLHLRQLSRREDVHQ
jgi:hypothetical protein